MMIYDIIGFIIASIILVKSAKYAAKHTVIIAKYFKINGFVVSLLLMGLLSTLPETSVSLISAANKISEIGFGTLVGSNIADLTIVLGIVALTARNIKIKSKLVVHEAWFILLTLLPLLFAYDGVIDRNDGVLLILASFFFLHHIFKERHIFDKIKIHRNHTADFGYSLTIVILNTFLLLASAYFIIYFSKLLSIDLFVPPIIIASIFIALGTCLPELLFSIQSSRQGQNEIAFGDIVGNVIIDSTLILGLTAIINPIIASIYIVVLYVIFTLGSIAMIMSFINIRQSINTWGGLILIFYYIAFVFAELIIKNMI